MNEKDLEMLTDLIDSCSISQTARRLYTTQPAVTKQLKKLEEVLESRCFCGLPEG